MTAFEIIRKNIALGAVLAATGLPASLAQAQFKVQYDSKTKSDQKQQDQLDESFTVAFNASDEKHTYELKIVNGEIKVAKMDGKQLDDDQVKFVGDAVVFLSTDGKKINEFIIKGTQGGKGVSASSAPKALTWVEKADTAETPAAKPKVMLGINLGEPSDAMRKQLKLGSDQRVILVEKVIDGLPAQKAGLEDFDVILSIDGSDFADGELLTKVLREKEAGDELKLIVLRSGDKLKISPKLTAYNAQKLGVPTAITINRSGDDMGFPAPLPPTAPSPVQNQWFGANMMPQLQAQINEALHSAGLSDDEIARVHEQLKSQLHEQLGQLGNRFFFSNDGDAQFEFMPGDEQEQRVFELNREQGAHAQEAERQQFELKKHLELAEVAKDKARQAMRDAERQIMEMRDGRLIVRSAERAQDQLGGFEDRLSALEARLEAQMDQFESQMDRMADMFEQLLERLENRDD